MFCKIRKINDSSIDILIYCFTKSNDWEKNLKTKENLAIFIKECVENNNLSFAFLVNQFILKTITILFQNDLLK